MLITKVKKAAVVLIATAIVPELPTSGAMPPTESFDKPIRKTVVTLGRSSLMPNDQIQLSCFYYPDFMVKQLNDPGVKGSQWVAITPVNAGDSPACQLAHTSVEQFMTKDGWYFEGVKGAFLFLEDSEGDENAGMPFRILDMKTGQKVFEDSAGGSSHLAFTQASNGNMSLKYLRRVGGDCSIPKDGVSCWDKFRRHYGLTLARVPKCSGYRREGGKEWVVGDKGVPPEAINVPSAIEYPALVELFPRPSIRAIPGPVRCFAE